MGLIFLRSAICTGIFKRIRKKKWKNEEKTSSGAWEEFIKGHSELNTIFQKF